MKSRLAAGVLAVVVAVGLVGCSGAAPKPSPTPTPPFASADAAYKAAEATYRGYVDAANDMDLAEPKTFNPIFGWLLGDALKTDQEELTAMSAKGWHWSGDSRIVLMKPSSASALAARWGDVRIAACLDVSEVNITDSQGVSVVAKDRPDVQPVKVTFSRDASTVTRMKIIEIEKRTGEPRCGGSSAR